MKVILSAILFSLITLTAAAQRYAIIDTKYILEKVPEYKEAQKKLDNFSELWQKEIDQKQAAMDKMYKDYDAEQVMLTDALKKKREDELFNREKEMRRWNQGMGRTALTKNDRGGSHDTSDTAVRSSSNNTPIRSRRAGPLSFPHFVRAQIMPISHSTPSRYVPTTT